MALAWWCAFKADSMGGLDVRNFRTRCRLCSAQSGSYQRGNTNIIALLRDKSGTFAWMLDGSAGRFRPARRLRGSLSAATDKLFRLVARRSAFIRTRGTEYLLN